MITVTASLDLEYLYKVNRKADVSAAKVKACMEHPRGGRRVARIDSFSGGFLEFIFP